jgi:D-cysteine desulfhydrase
MIRASGGGYAAAMTGDGEPARFRLIDAPSPLAPLPRLAAALGGRAEVWIKREDLLPLAFGGNKLRNLEPLVAAALAEGADCLVTAGRRWSNHCRLTAAAGAVAGLDVHLVLSGPAMTPRNPGSRLDELLGATVHQAVTADRAERETLVERVVTDLRAAGRRPYVIGVGGGGVLGASGQLRAAAELLVQARERSIELAAVVVPSATGGTQAGLLAGLRAGGSTAAVVGIAVAHPPAELRPTIAALLDGLGRLTGVPVAAAEIELDGDWLGPGYGVPTEAAEEAARLLARTEGLFVDPIYTAKGLAGLIGAVRAGRFDGRQVVFWHAGGLPGLFEPLDEPVRGG